MIQTVGSTFVVLLLTVLGCRLPSTKGRQILLLAVSYLFYANWGIGFLSILIISSLMNYTWGCALRRKATTPRLWIGIALNLLPLAFFKYLPVLLELGPAGSWQYDLGRQIILPVGMSFWTFQGLSYLFDIYFGGVGPFFTRVLSLYGFLANGGLRSYLPPAQHVAAIPSPFSL